MTASARAAGAALTAAALSVLLLLARPTDAAGPEAPRPVAATTATTATTAATAPTAASGTAFWANVGVERLAHPRPPAVRAGLLLALLREQDATLGMLAETTGRQVRALRRLAGGQYAVVATARRGETNAVVLATRTFRLERVVRFRTFAYRGRRVPASVALLRERASGARVAVLAVHHPASNTGRGSQDRWQRASWRRELRVLRHLRSAYGGRLSTFLGGDFNQRATCRLVARTGMVSPVGTVSSCPTARTRIDQLFADPTVTFHRYRSLRHGAARRATDHAGMYAADYTLRQPS